jgi:DNA-binding NarL/FixJ family response regulator
MQHIGWRWLCPGCKKEVRKVYYPLPPRTLFDFLGYDPAVCHGRVGRAPQKFQRYDLHKLDPPPPTFACTRCHGIHTATRCNGSTWNQVVTHLTRGMLYGHEVEKPHWYRRQRKRARFRVLTRPAPRRQAVLVRLSNGWTIEQISQDLLMNKPTVERNIRHICKQERVKNRTELAAKLGWKHHQPLNGRELLLATARHREDLVQPLLLEGLTYEAISRRTRLTSGAVNEAVNRIYKKHGLKKREGRRGLMEKLQNTSQKNM